MSVSGGPDIAQDGLIMYYNFINPTCYTSGSTFVSDIVQPVTGSINIPTGIQFDGNGNGLNFTQTGIGGSTYIRVNNVNHNSLTRATYVTWMKLPSSSVNLSRLFWGTTEGSGSNVYGYQSLGIDAQGMLFASNGKGGNGPDPIISTSITINDDQWHMITFQYEVGDKLYLYVDNQKVVGPSFPSKGAQSTSSIIGGSYNNGVSKISGSIHSVMWYNRVLSSDEIQQNYNAQRSRFGV